ncbi:hypothetical protein U9M48_014371 [Paspalum notatum var. saurae]|uniref:Uncharacterized protein n=1 Tax=Paspalum notatum var. saurae TaxID=547442 RepID=A0AAQ3T140_PASNO
MGALNGRNPSALLDGLYGVQLGRPSQPARSEDEVLLTTGVESTCPQKRGTTQQRLLIGRLWQQRPSCLKPIHCSITCDKHAGETIANVVTSLPFIVLGLQTPRQGTSLILKPDASLKNLNTAIYANSLVGVGIASSLYHSSKGEIRKFLRWADYTMIATTTLVIHHILALSITIVVRLSGFAHHYNYVFHQCLSRALRNENPRLLTAASALLLPFQPLMVSAVHTGLMEASNANDPACLFQKTSMIYRTIVWKSNFLRSQVSFARRASSEPELKMAHNLHKMSSLLGGALFIADDYFPETPYIHAAWHLAAAIGVGTCNKLLE